MSTKFFSIVEVYNSIRLICIKHISGGLTRVWLTSRVGTKL